MSLFRQLWLAVGLLLTLVFGGTFIVSSLSAKAYLEQQLTMKNADNANALALSLTQQDADEILLELTLSAQFDTGFYEMIELRAPDGEVIIRREDTQPVQDAPGWFMALLPIDVEPGVAAVQDGWQQLGIITLRSHSKFAYQELWKSTVRLAGVFAIAMVLAGALGSYLLRIILRPLGEVVDQAEAIGNRRFISIDEPYTREFRQVAGAMNKLSSRIKGVLEHEAQRLEKWQRDATVDKVTQLMNRGPFMSALAASLESDDVNATGSIALIRLGALTQLNKIYGRRAIDQVLNEIGVALNDIVLKHSRWAASRLNGSDFALLAPRATEAAAAAKEAQAAIISSLERHGMREDSGVPCAATIYTHGETVAEIMTRLDQSLLESEEGGDSRIIEVYRSDTQRQSLQEQLDEWRQIFERAFEGKFFSLAGFPAVDLDRALLHREAPVRLTLEGEILSAGQFLPWLNRLEMSYLLDKEVLALALKRIEESNEPTAVNLSVAAVVEEDFAPWLDQQLSGRGTLASKLWLEIPEAMAFRHLPKFRLLAQVCSRHGTHIGIEHMGHKLSQLGELSDIGVDYLKIDASFVRDVDQNAANQTLLRTLCTVGHSIGLTVLAEGVRTEEEWLALKDLGVDGATGTGIQLA